MNDRMQFLSLVLGFALWAALGIMKFVPLEPLIALLQMGLGGLITHMLKGTDAPAPAASPSPQGGFASLHLMTILAAIGIGMALLAGCTTTTASMYAGLATQAKAGIQTFDDNTLATMHDLLCAQPYSAIQRHPELQPGIVALCGPMTNTASLDPGQVAAMLSIAKQLNLVPSAPATAASAAKP